MEPYDYDRQYHIDEGHIRCECGEWIEQGPLCAACQEPE